MKELAHTFSSVVTLNAFTVAIARLAETPVCPRLGGWRRLEKGLERYDVPERVI